MVFEIRNYHIKPEMLNAYREWATALAIPYLSKNLNAVGFWSMTADAPEIRGEPDELGPANIVWMIKWTDLGQRKETLAVVLGSETWKEISAHVPGGPSVYLRAEIKFLESLAEITASNSEGI
jgi:hypothetical protein